MKKLMLLPLALVLMACSGTPSKFGQGGQNAAQFVKEQVPELRDDIENIETIEEDTLLSDIGLSFANLQLLQAESDYYEGKISRDRLQQIIDSVSWEIGVVEKSWKYGTVSKNAEKYKGQFRRVYTVRVTMKSGVTKEPRVLMDKDGITPQCMENDFEKSLKQYTDNLMGVINRILYGI